VAFQIDELTALNLNNMALVHIFMRFTLAVSEEA